MEPLKRNISLLAVALFVSLISLLSTMEAKSETSSKHDYVVAKEQFGQEILGEVNERQEVLSIEKLKEVLEANAEGEKTATVEETAISEVGSGVEQTENIFFHDYISENQQAENEEEEVTEKTDVTEVTKVAEITEETKEVETTEETEVIEEIEVTEVTEVAEEPEVVEETILKIEEEASEPEVIIPTGGLTARMGVYNGPSGKETYYNLNMSGVVSIMTNYGYSQADYWVRADGVKMLGQYVMVAADFNIRPRGSLVQTSLGMGLVCDTGTFTYSNPTQIDIATTW